MTTPDCSDAVEIARVGLHSEILGVRKLSEAVLLMDKWIRRQQAKQAAKKAVSSTEHVCGLQGFRRGLGSENDRCPACEEMPK